MIRTPAQRRLDAALDALAGGRPVVIADVSPERPCLLAAAGDRVTAGTVNTMATLGHSFLCVCIPLGKYLRLGLPAIHPDDAARRPFAGMAMVEASKGVTTGISAADRATTIRAACAPDAERNDLARPGHVLIAPVAEPAAEDDLRAAACELAARAECARAAVVAPVLDQAGCLLPSRAASTLAARIGIPLISAGDLGHEAAPAAA